MSPYLCHVHIKIARIRLEATPSTTALSWPPCPFQNHSALWIGLSQRAQCLSAVYFVTHLSVACSSRVRCWFDLHYKWDMPNSLMVETILACVIIHSLGECVMCGVSYAIYILLSRSFFVWLSRYLSSWAVLSCQRNAYIMSIPPGLVPVKRLHQNLIPSFYTGALHRSYSLLLSSGSRIQHMHSLGFAMISSLTFWLLTKLIISNVCRFLSRTLNVRWPGYIKMFWYILLCSTFSLF